MNSYVVCNKPVRILQDRAAYERSSFAHPVGYFEKEEVVFGLFSLREDLLKNVLWLYCFTHLGYVWIASFTHQDCWEYLE
jgi:hypothetical protein